MDGLNVYLYVGNNPVNHIDPEGLEADDTRWTADGHHYVAGAEVRNQEAQTGRWSDDVTSRLDTHRVRGYTTDGETVAHTFAGHDQYSLRTRGIINDYLEKTGVDPTKLRGAAANKWADGLVIAIKNSNDDYVKTYLQMVEAGASKDVIKAWANAYKTEALTVPKSEKFWLKRIPGQGSGGLLGRASAKWGQRALASAIPVFAILSYQQAKAQGWSDEAASLYAGIDYLSPVPLPTTSFLGSVNSAVDAQIQAPFDEFREAGHRARDPNACTIGNAQKVLKEFVL